MSMKQGLENELEESFRCIESEDGSGLGKEEDSDSSDDLDSEDENEKCGLGIGIATDSCPLNSLVLLAVVLSATRIFPLMLFTPFASCRLSVSGWLNSTECGSVLLGSHHLQWPLGAPRSTPLCCYCCCCYCGRGCRGEREHAQKGREEGEGRDISPG
jgi:hypothetical protein